MDIVNFDAAATERKVVEDLTESRDTYADRTPDSIYGVICTEGCNKQGLTDEQYKQQMARPDSTWRCPNCMSEAWWDDERYDAGIEAAQEAAEKRRLSQEGSDAALKQMEAEEDGRHTLTGGG